MDFKDRQRLIGQKKQWWDMSNYVKSGFTLKNVKKNMIEIDDPNDPDVVETWKFREDNKQLYEEQARERERIKLINEEEEEERKNQERKERYAGVLGFFRYVGDGLTSVPEAYKITKKAGVIDAGKVAFKDGLDKAVDKVVNNPVVNTFKVILEFFHSLIQNRYLYLAGIIFVIILIKKA